ncbi:hypothetical protein PAT3040_05036 [Paenibacillus agaridevorans]|uniref:SLH domain-containing protein n=1 Tax=Paenibacillus agaridevorans TaxID=171404 RepID=A0A2R5EUG8_9BACL|nr:S-layer homology domain-containing protein [Paenibacillus agaridevorans]GBG10310.1 hypothetical protein PAT3040_05036 [Paenibacillus agaridevorans]
MKSNLYRKWIARFVVVFLFTTIALPFGPERRVLASACDGVTPGTSDQCPIIITDAPGLHAMRNNLAGHYALGADIDLSDYLSPTGAGYNDGDGWEPVGTGGHLSNAFSGTLDGNGHTISHLQITSTAGTVGLFGVTSDAVIRNIGLIDVDISGKGETSDVGGLVGYIVGTTIENAYVTGTVEGADGVGGLVGLAYGVTIAPSRIRASYASANVIGTGAGQVGGLVGSTEGHDIRITESYYNSSLASFSGNGIGLTTSQMKHAANFDLWDFSEQGQWGILEGMTFPMHRTTLDQIVLDELAINDGEMVYEPEFAPHIATYSSRVTGEVDSVRVSASSGSSRANVLINGEDLDSKVISLVPGANNVDITVSTDVVVPGADTNPFEAAYTLQVIREDGIDYAHRITTASQLAAIGTAPYALSGDYELMNDLDLAGMDWNPIGDGGQPFTGTFEGNRSVIRNLTVDSTDDYAGLFGASSGIIRNIGLENAVISGGSLVGGLVGSNTGFISNAYVKGNVDGDEHVGGLVGLNSGAANVTFTYAAGLVSGNAYTGGLIGKNASGVVDDSYWDAEIGSLLISGGGEGKTTADMQLPATYEGWDWDDSWAMINGTTYPMFVDSFEAVKLQSLAATADDAELTWTSGTFSPSQGVYELLADRYMDSVTITAAPAVSNATVTIGTTESVSEQLAVAVGSNEIVVTTTGVFGRPDGEYRLIIEVPAPELIDFAVPEAGLYGIGDTLAFTIGYGVDVDVTGAPTIPVTIGEGADATTVYAVYAGQPVGERNKLIFTYDVQEGLAYDNAIEIGMGIGLPDGAEIHVADTDIAVQRNLPTRATTGIIIDAVRPEILLSQEPANTVPTNESIAITVNADGTGSAIAALKWAEGLRTKAYFAAEGIELSGDSFQADANGTYSVFAQDEAGNSFVATIEIGNIIKTMPEISLTPTLAEGSRSVSVSALAEAHGDINRMTKLNWMQGSRSVADFADGTSGTDIMTDGLFIVTENDVYTVYAKDAAGNEAVEEIRISNIWNPVYYPVPNKNQELQLNYTDFGIQLIVDSSIISKETLEDGTVVEHVILTDKILERVLDALGKAAGSFVSIVVNDSEQAVQVQFPASSLVKLKTAYPAATFEVRLNASSYELQVNALPLESKSSVTHVKIAIGQIAGQQKESLERAASNAGLKRISHAISYEVTVSSDGRIEEIRDFGGIYIVRAIVLDEGRSDGPIVAVLYDPATGKLHFAPAVTRARDDGTPEMAIKVPHNSIYAIMEAEDKTYSDLDGHWAKTSVELLASKLIVNGVSATEFAPNSSITRAEFTSLLVRGLGLNVGQSAQSAIFHDVAQGDWHAAAIEAGVKAGLVKGVSENEFAPDRFITREQMAVMLSNALAVLGYAPIHPDQAPTVLDKFEDHTTISPWAKAAVAQAVNAGIISGMTDDSFAPSNFATRAQAVVMLRRFLQYVEFID